MVFATVDARAQREQKQRQDDCINAAILSGLRSSAIALAASGSMTWLLTKYSEAFKFKFPVSAKTSFVVMAPFYVFWMESERSVGRCRMKGENNKHMHLDKLTGGVDHREALDYNSSTSSSSSSSSSSGGSSSSPDSSSAAAPCSAQ